MLLNPLRLVKPIRTQIVFSEQDPTLMLSIAAGEQGDDLIINSEGRGTSEIWLAEASDPSPTPYRCLARQNNTRYRLHVDKTQLFISQLRSGPEARDQFTLLSRAPGGCEVDLPKGVQLEEDESLEDFEVLERETLILVRRGATARLIAISHTAPEIPIDVRLPAPWSERSAVALRFGQPLPNGTFKLYASTPSRPEVPLYYRDSSQPMLSSVVTRRGPAYRAIYGGNCSRTRGSSVRSHHLDATQCCKPVGRTPPVPALGHRLWKLWQYIIHRLLSF